jgi:threonine dehydratase
LTGLRSRHDRRSGHDSSSSRNRRRHDPAHPDDRVGDHIEQHWHRSRAQSGEPPADGFVQDPRSVDQTGVAWKHSNERRDRWERWQSRPGPGICHPFDDETVVAGQGTIGLELVDDVVDLRTVIVPLGGGGLSAGIAIAVKTLRPDVRVIGVQAAACAPYAGMPPNDGPIATLADGIAIKSPGAITGPLVEHWLDEVVTVDEDTTAGAMMMLMERAKLVVEGAGAVGVAALMSGAINHDKRGTTCALISGGNVDLGVIPGLIRRHENLAGRRLTVFVRLDDQPGSLARLLEIFGAQGANLIEVEHVREGLDLHVRETGVRATFEVRGPDFADRAVASAQTAGYAVSLLSLPR